ncbi:MAG TPA: hypothetical protein VFD53_06065 [Ilumatobacter sp.]|nr:hypothetical protein [Ilumatobacter sp.]
MAITSTVTPESSVDAELHPDADAVRAEAAPTRGHIGRIVAGSIIGGVDKF